MTINERMRLIRKTIKLTQEEFGNRLGVSFAAVSMTEGGKNGVSDRIVRDMVREFAVNEGWLRTGEGSMFLPQMRQEQIASFIGDVLRDDNSFRLRLISTLSRLTPAEWEMLEKRIAEINEKAAPD